MFLYLQHGPFNELFSRGLFAESFFEDSFKDYYELQYEGLFEAVKTWPDFADVSRKIETWGKDIFLKACKAVKSKPTEFNVLNHGGTYKKPTSNWF